MSRLGNLVEASVETGGKGLLVLLMVIGFICALPLMALGWASVRVGLVK